MHRQTVLLVFFCILLALGCRRKEAATATQAVTFNRDVAPLVWQKCTPCHRPGESAPFALITYQDVKRHAKQVVEVTKSGFMPPWMPKRDGTFKGERKLSETELSVLENWLRDGLTEGKEADLPPKPVWPEGWQLGTPDLVLDLPVAYELAASGPDEYRNFVIHTGLQTKRFVRAIEFRPQTRAVHHAFIKIDRTQKSAALDGHGGPPGFPGIHGPETAQMPDGQFLTWQPGKWPAFSPDGCSWPLDPGVDFVLQLHLQPSGKVEQIRPRMGVYFTESPPSKILFKPHLVSYAIHIPAGATNVNVERAMTLPCDVTVLRVLPHAHFLATRVEADALLPTGIPKSLITIPRWDFNWQGDYEYVVPQMLPKGTTIRMRFTYDNSRENPRNRQNPPLPVTYGPSSTNEMAELWLQTLVENSSDLSSLQQAQELSDTQAIKEGAEMRVALNPNDASAHMDLGMMFINEDQITNALSHFEAASTIDPTKINPHYFRGIALRMLGRRDEAVAEFNKVLALKPDHGKAHGNLAQIFGELGNRAQALEHAQAALRADPSDQLARDLIKDLQR